MCPYPGANDLKSRMDTFPNNLKFVQGVDSARQKEKQNPWAWGRDDGEACCCLGCGSETVLCGCYSYSRAWTRLEMAAYDQDATDIPEIRPCNFDCAQFALGLPFYALCLGSLQKAVRKHYSIDGDDCQDYCDACCSPRKTLVRVEGEIIFREQVRKGKQVEKLEDKQYLCYDPMAYPIKQEQPSPAARQAATPGQSKINSYQHTLPAHSQPAKLNRRPMHSLEDDLAAPSRAKQQEHILGDDIESAAPTKPTPHDLGATASRAGPLKNETGPVPSSL
ncbi:hypothetical protein GGI43DRAFT_96866 [Trichoderma evansii]